MAMMNIPKMIFFGGIILENRDADADAIVAFNLFITVLRVSSIKVGIVADAAETYTMYELYVVCTVVRMMEW